MWPNLHADLVTRLIKLMINFIFWVFYTVKCESIIKKACHYTFYGLSTLCVNSKDIFLFFDEKMFLVVLPNDYLRLQAWNFINKETLTQVFCCEFCVIFKNTFLKEHIRSTASEHFNSTHISNFVSIF